MTDAHTHNEKLAIPGIINIEYTDACPKFDSHTLANPDCHFSLGVHPWKSDKDIDRAGFEKTAVMADAIGECGLDKCKPISLDVQMDVFRWQIGVAERLEKPVIVHCVRAYGLLMDCLREHKDLHWLIHGCNASPEWIREASKYHVWFSVGPMQLQNQYTKGTLSSIPGDRLLLETDASAIEITEVYSMARIGADNLDDNFKCFMNV